MLRQKQTEDVDSIIPEEIVRACFVESYSLRLQPASLVE